LHINPGRLRARRVMDLVRDAIGHAVEMPGCTDERSEVQALVGSLKAQCPICVVTQDEAEARAVLALRDGTGQTVAAVRLTAAGDALSWQQKSTSSRRPATKAGASAAPERVAFEEGSEVVGADGKRHRL